jgi:methylenetetrahydrofolate dehydrogenase (NADP+)/methenyltetrahydrofolate cyclohydrolase
MALLLKGKPVADKIAENLIARIKKLGRPPVLAIVSVGGRADSASFIVAKQKFAERIGAQVQRVDLREDASQNEVEIAIKKCAAFKTVDGIILQLPLPPHLDSSVLLNLIPPSKDVDGLTAYNLRALLEGKPKMVPATARGIINLLEAYALSVEGKQVVVVGRSVLVGKSVALTLLAKNATVTLCHRKTKNLSTITKTADILIIATGSPKLINKEYVREGQVVIDVGITKSGLPHPDGSLGEPDLATGKSLIVGDVDMVAIESIVEAVSPVPGGVGPMTVSALFENVVDAAFGSVQPK